MKAWMKRNYYRLYYRNKKVIIREQVLLNTRNYFEGLNAIEKNCEIATSSIGLGSYISDNSIIRHAKIGRFCSIGSYVQTGLGTHPSKTFVSTHPAFFSTQQQAGFSFTDHDIFQEQQFIDTDKKYVVEIGNDVWIGNNVMIMDGLTIGDGAIIAAGAVVTQNVAPYAVVGGLPAKLLRYRFSEQQIEKLLHIQWWHWDIEKIRSHSTLFSDIESFLSSVKN